ncbi:hypothetical protein QO179_24415 [Bacillus stercoris]|nr:hypothetical protein [Bacillus stercoris]
MEKQMNVKSLTSFKAVKESKINTVLNAAKCEVLKEFEKICPTDMSFQRVRKDMHNIFDKIQDQLEEIK